MIIKITRMSLHCEKKYPAVREIKNIANLHVCMSQHQEINGNFSSRSICYGMIMRAPQKKS